MLQPGGAQRAPGLGDVDHAVGDVGDLGLAGAVRQPHVGVDAALGEEALVISGYSEVTRTPSGRSSTDSNARVAGDRDDDPHRVGRGLRVLQFAEADDVAAGLLDPVAAGDPEVEQALGDVDGDLLRAQDPHLGDARVVDRRLVVDRRRTDTVRSAASNSSSVAFSSEPLGKHDPQHDVEATPVGSTRQSLGDGQCAVGSLASRRRACGSTSSTASICSIVPFGLTRVCCR